jgi:hypothetical protein
MSTFKNINFAEKGLLLVILTSSLVLRSLAMGNRDLDLDEAFSFIFVTEHSLLELCSPFSPAITNDAHPPIYYLFSYLWVHSGYPILNLLSASREFAFRFPFAIAGLSTTYIMYRIGKQAGDKHLALFLALIHAINSFSVQVTHQARMYPLVELLSAIILLRWLSLFSELRHRSIVLLSLMSSILFLTHYASLFYILVIWGTLCWHYRSQIKAMFLSYMSGSLLLILWLPALWTQYSREAVSSVTNGSTGAIIPFTLFHFLSGDRGLSLGSFFPGIFHSSLILLTVLYVALLIFFLRRIGIRFPSNYQLPLILIVPLILHWIATFEVQRVFNGTHYAIYSLPAFLLLISIIMRSGSRVSSPPFAILIVTLFVINSITLFCFFNNSLAPFEPWRQAAKSIRSFSPERVYIYPSYLSVLFRFYGPDLPVIELSSECEITATASGIAPMLKHGGGHDKSRFLVISHDRGFGAYYLNAFREAYDERPYSPVFHHIQIHLFGGKS